MRAVTGPTGAVTARYDYEPFGALWQASPNPPTERKRFTGQEHDDATGLDYFGARFYDANVGRFTTIDPVYTWNENLLDPQRWNRCAYARSNPLRYVDPDGRRDVLVVIWNRRLLDASVAHVAVLETNGSVILSQFPTPRGTSGANTLHSYAETLALEDRQPDKVFRVFVPDDDRFDNAASDHKGRKQWTAIPSGSDETNCVTAAADALKEGGVPVKEPLWPGNMGDDLTKLSGQKPRKGQKWTVRPAKVDDILKKDEEQ